MRQQRARIRGMSEMFIQSASDEPMVGFDKNCAGKILAEGIDRCQSDDDSREQQQETERRDEITARLNTPDVDKT